MSETEKRGSPWPWILVPIAAVGLFFVLRECRQNLPPAEHATAPAAAVPAAPQAPDSTPAPAEPNPADAGTAPDTMPPPRP
jgi:hypothetical protein